MKIASERTAPYIKKEIKVYEKLASAGYEYIPKLVAIRGDHLAFALEDLSHCDFTDTWDVGKLRSVMKARESLKEHIDLFRDDEDFVLNPQNWNSHNLWPKLLNGNNLDDINAKLQLHEQGVVLTQDFMLQCNDLMKDWQMASDTLVHYDIRSDNFAYDTTTNTGKIIDWNWLCIGDNEVDVTPIFIDAINKGFDAYSVYPEKFYSHAVGYILGFWLDALISNDNSLMSLRRRQAESVAVCYNLLQNFKIIEE